MMIRDKIMKLHRHKSSSSSASDKSAQRCDFSFSNFRALQVPKGWDKLSVSLIYIETGKTVSKSGKASVRNGNCQWTETWAQSIWITPDDISNKKEQCLFKFIITMGSSRSSILGEAAVNPAKYMDAKAHTLVSLPLRKCNYGTVLQVEIKCLTESRNKEVSMHTEEEKIEYNNPENKSEETGIPALSLYHSFGSTEDSLDRDSFSSQSDSNRPVSHTIDRQESVDSRSSASFGSYSFCDSPSFNSMNVAASSRNSIQGKDNTSKELSAEAMMWKQNAQSLKVDLEMSRKEFADQTQQIENLKMEVCSLGTERDGLMQKIKHLDFLLQESMEKEKETGRLMSRVRDLENSHNVFKEELRIQKESNDSLSLQLSKTQESNIQLLSILQEMEETVEKQKLENKNLIERSKSEIELEQSHRSRALLDCEEKWKIRSSEQEEEIAFLKAELSRLPIVEDSEANKAKLAAECDLISKNEILNEKIEELERDCKELTEENAELLYKLKSNETSTSSGSILSSLSIEGQLSEDDDIPKENTPCSCCLMLKDSNKVLEVKSQNLSSDNVAKNSEILELKTKCLAKDAEIKAQRHHQTGLRNQISDLETSKWDMESAKNELELNLHELEKENVHLSERVSGLEAQLRHLTDEVEFNRLELHHSGNCVVKLHEKIRELEHEKELRKLDMKEKLHEMQIRWLDAQEECEYLRKLNPKLQATTESLMEECHLLQTLNTALRQQKSKLHMNHDLLEITEENSRLKMKLKVLPLLHEEVLTLKGELSGKKFESERLQVSLQLISGVCEELKAENTTLLLEIAHIQKVVAEAEECKYKKIALEEKVLRLEGDLTAKEVMCAKVSELKNELCQVRRANNQFLGKIKSLQLEKEECLKQVKSVEEKLQRKQLDSQREDDETIPTREFKISEAEKEDFGKHRSPQSESSCIHESHLISLSSKGRDKNMHKICQLEAELKEIRDRYLHMSLKYAEVEDEREQLVMTLKAMYDQKA